MPGSIFSFIHSFVCHRRYIVQILANGKRPLGRPRRRWEDNIKMDLQEVGRGCGD